jgi:hypothetical protein
MTGAQRGETARKHAAWLRECARRADALAAEYRANAERISARADELECEPGRDAQRDTGDGPPASHPG